LRDYEILYIVRPDLDDEKVQEAVKRVNTLIERSGGSADHTNLLFAVMENPAKLGASTWPLSTWPS